MSRHVTHCFARNGYIFPHCVILFCGFFATGDKLILKVVEAERPKVKSHLLLIFANK